MLPAQTCKKTTSGPRTWLQEEYMRYFWMVKILLPKVWLKECDYLYKCTSTYRCVWVQETDKTWITVTSHHSTLSSKKLEQVFPKKSQVHHHQPHSLPGLQWGSSEATQSLSTAEVLRRGLPLLPFSPHRTGHSCGPWSFPEHSSALVKNCTCLLIQDTWYSRMNRCS